MQNKAVITLSLLLAFSVFIGQNSAFAKGPQGIRVHQENKHNWKENHRNMWQTRDSQNRLDIVKDRNQSIKTIQRDTELTREQKKQQMRETQQQFKQDMKQTKQQNKENWKEKKHGSKQNWEKTRSENQKHWWDFLNNK